MATGPGQVATQVDPGKIEMGLATVQIDGTEYAARSVSISHEISYHTPEIPGALGPIDGLSYLTQFVPQAEIEMIDYDGSPFDGVTGHALPTVGDVTITGYKLKDGTAYETTIKNAMITDFSKEYGGQDEEATQSMTLVGTYGIDGTSGEILTDKPIQFGSSA